LKNKNLDKSESDIFANIILSRSGRGIIANNEVVKKALQNNPIGTYTLRYIYYILTSIEELQKDVGDLLRGIKEKTNSLSLEHIMPQKITSEWQKDLGDDWQRIHDEYLNNIGNLTLTAYNSKYSNKPFNFKKECDNGFNDSNLNLNAFIKTCDIWNEENIVKRQEMLINEFIKCFPMPTTTFSHSLQTDKVLNIKDLLHKGISTKPCRIFVDFNEEYNEEYNDWECFVKDWQECFRNFLSYCYNKDITRYMKLLEDGKYEHITSFEKKAHWKALSEHDNVYFNCSNVNRTIDFMVEVAEFFEIADNVFVELE